MLPGTARNAAAQASTALPSTGAFSFSVAALRAVPGGDPPLGAHATLYALLCAVAALHATCGDAAGDAHDAVANAAEALR